ncbi:MAG TPA: PP2C family protein-serine/threonine phosphatase [Terracidiphilus sp.]|nr:PP2C family protein-serine/threonine phosphatase [Terracidiphilus sp.]
MPITVVSDVVRNDMFRLMVGELIMSAGVVALILHRFRSRTTDRSTLYFGLASLLYGLWLIVELQVLHSAFPSIPWRIIESSINLVIGIPFVLYIGSTIGRAYPWFVRGVVTANVLLAILGTVRLVQQASMDRIQSASWVLAVVSLAGWVYIAVFPKIPIDREVRALRVGLLVLALFALYQHLSVMGGLPRAGFLEPIGMVFLLGTFFYVSAARSYRMETNFIAIRNELEIARQIQSALLPRLSGAIGGVEVHSRYSPAGSVAGDFYDVLSDGHGLGVLIADVSGHGVPAALSASMMKVALRAQAEQMANPALVLAGLNKTLCGTLQDQYITAAYVYCDTEHHELRYAGAGHPPVLLWRSGARKVDALEENGLFLGPFPGAEYASLCTAFEPGDRCLLYTDGLVEASNHKDEEFGAERLSEFLARNSGLEANAACSALLDQVTAWLGGELERQQDDITFVVVEFRPAEVDAST